MEATTIPYCGPAPLPAEIWSAWNFDPAIIIALCALAALFHLRSSTLEIHRARALHAALLILAIAFLSPLCALSTALFSARIAHHLLLIAIAAPLLALAFPARNPARAATISALFLLHTVLVWLWHAPTPYAFALTGDAAYWLMETSLLASAFALWRALLGNPANAGASLAALLGSIVQMGMLGALLTFAKQPLFSSHFLTTEPFGLSPLADQQLAGLIMWVPAALPYLLAALVIASRLIGRHLPADGGRAA